MKITDIYGKEDVVDIKFKSLSNKYKENDLITLVGNLRTYSQQISETKRGVPHQHALEDCTTRAPQQGGAIARTRLHYQVLIDNAVA